MTWEQGRATVENLIKTGMLERVPRNVDAARWLVEVAETHLASALMLAGSDTVLAYDALHGANPKALTAILLAKACDPPEQAATSPSTTPYTPSSNHHSGETCPPTTESAGHETPATTAASTTPSQSPTTCSPTTPAARKSSTSPSAS